MHERDIEPKIRAFIIESLRNDQESLTTIQSNISVSEFNERCWSVKCLRHSEGISRQRSVRLFEMAPRRDDILLAPCPC
jgi:hypothetical protein